MNGLFINNRRPKSKKEVKEAVANAPDSVVIEYTQFGYERTISLTAAIKETVGFRTTFVGPDPQTSRKYYGEIIANNGKVTVK